MDFVPSNWLFHKKSFFPNWAWNAEFVLYRALKIQLHRYSLLFDEKEKVKDFIDKQNKRKIATKFYEFIKEEFIEKPLKTKEKELTDEFRKSESKKNKQNFQVLEKYLLYIFGKKRMEKELDKVKKTEEE